MGLSLTDQKTMPYAKVRLAFWVLWSLALVVKLQCAMAVGSFDVYLYAKYGAWLTKLGFAGAYAADPNYNIPPLAALFSSWIGRAVLPDFELYAFFLKLPGVLAEAALAVILWRRFGQETGPRRWLAVLFVANPVAILVTGFHGNLDGLLAVFIGMALLMAMDDRPIACAIWFGLAANLKVSPVLIAPAFFFWWWYRGKAWHFSAVTALVVLAGWSPGLILFPKLFFERVIAYGSVWGIWGISRILFLTKNPDFHAILYGAPTAHAKIIAAVLKALVLGSALALAWRRRKGSGEELVITVAAVWTVFFVFAPGGAAQYTIWPVLPLLFYNVRLGAYYLLAATPFLAAFYPFMYASIHPKSDLAKAWPGLGVTEFWTWPGLFLWAFLVVVLAREWGRWWKAPVEIARVVSDAKAESLPSAAAA